MTEAGMSMGELVEASGVHRQTIHSYLREGLLPPPCAGAGTRHARYGAAHLELLALLRELRDGGMSLEAIRRCFERGEFEPLAIRRSLERAGAWAAPSLAIGGPPELVSGARLGAELADELRGALIEAFEIAPETGDEFDALAAELLDAAGRLLERGLDGPTVIRVARLARELATVEAAALAAEATALDGSLARATRRAEERYQHLGELCSRARLWLLRRVVRRLERVGEQSLEFARDAIYVPSELFIRRYQLERVRQEVERRAAAGDPGECLALGRLLLGLGRYAEAEIWLTRAARAAPDSAEARCYVGLTRAIQGSHHEGVKLCEDAVRAAPGSPRARAFLATARALVAVHSAGAEELAPALAHAIDLAFESVALEPADDRERLETLIARGRLMTVLPPELPGHTQGIADLEAVVAATSDPAAAQRGLDFPGSAELYRMHALYYLGMAALARGARERAEEMLRECITIDPASLFAHRAYETLSSSRVADGP